MDSSQNAANQDASLLTSKLDHIEKQVFSAGRKGVSEFLQWEAGNTSKLTTSETVVNHKKRKRSMIEWHAILPVTENPKISQWDVRLHNLITSFTQGHQRYLKTLSILYCDQAGIDFSVHSFHIRTFIGNYFSPDYFSNIQAFEQASLLCKVNYFRYNHYHYGLYKIIIL